MESSRPESTTAEQIRSILSRNKRVFALVMIGGLLICLLIVTAMLFGGAK